MRFSARALGLAAALAAACAVPADAGGARVGLAVPLEGSSELLGTQMRDGALLAARDAGAEMIVANTACSKEGGVRAARQFVAEEVGIVVGFLCFEAIEAALPILSEAGIPTVTSGVRTNALTDRRERTGWLVWRAAPRADAEAAAASEILVQRWRDQLFAIVDDGTVYGRDLSETLRLAVETAGLQPVFVDTFRPQSENQVALVGRLRRAGASHVFVGGDREDIAVIARDAEELDHELTIAGGEALRAVAETPLAEGTLMIGLPEWADVADPDVLERFSAPEIAPDGYVLPTYAATQIALAALEQAKATGASLPDLLSGGPFQTVLGPIAFDDKGDLSENPFRLLRYDGERFVPVE